MTTSAQDNSFSKPNPTSHKRLLSLDVMRGITIACMIIVNNAGGPESYAQLRHSVWNGLTVCDLVFPFFLFIMGVTTYLSMTRMRERPLRESLLKILRRTVVILLVCWALHWFGNICEGKGWFDFGHLRLTGVLTRIALCYCVVALLSLGLREKAMLAIAALLLTIYGVILIVNNGYANSLENVNAIVDRWLLPEGLLYTRQPVDPEGILGTVPSISHTIIGYCFGVILKGHSTLDRKLLRLAVYGTMLILAGLLLTDILPVNKRIWSPSYVLLTCGMAAVLLSTLSYFIDIDSKAKWFRFFEAFGVNPLFLYVVAEALSEILGVTDTSGLIYNGIFSIVGNACLSSAIYSVGLMLIMGCLAYPLYRKRIYIKI